MSPGTASRILRASALALAAASFARADGDPSAETFRRAELAERSLGKLESAAALYREAAAAAAAAEARALAEIRAASCLRRLGRIEEARALLVQWTATRPDVPESVRGAAVTELEALGGAPAPTAPAAAPNAAADLAERERELEKTRQEVDLLVERSRGFEAELAAGAKRMREMEAEIARLRAESAPPEPTNADEVLEIQRRERERRRAEAKALASTYLKAARRLHQEGRFDEARAFLYDALERDPDDPDAHALLARVSAPLGERESLFKMALGVAALAREVRASRRSAEVTELVEEARRRQQRGDFAGSSAPLERALAWIDASPDLVRGGADLRGEVASMLQAAASHGVPRAPSAPPEPDAAEAEWSAALHGLLAAAGREAAQGLDLRFHDLAVVIASSGLPPFPVGAEPAGWSVSTKDIDSPRLAASWIRATESAPLATPGARLGLVGSTCAVLADPAAQRRIADRLNAVRLAAPAAIDLQMDAWRTDRGAIAERLAARGVPVTTLDGGARAASLDPTEFDALTDAIGRTASQPVARGTLRATPMRPFRVQAGTAAARLSLDVLALPPSGEGHRPGLGVRVESASLPPGRTDGPFLRSEALAGASVAAGGGLVVFGIPDPERPGVDVAILVRTGTAGPREAPLPLPTPEQGADEVRLPAVLAAIEDPPPPPLLVPERPVPSRSEGIVARARQAAGPRVRQIEMGDGRLLVAGPADCRKAVADLVTRIGADPRPARFDVRFHQLAPVAKQRLYELCPRSSPAMGGAMSWVVLPAGSPELRAATLYVAGADGEIRSLATELSAPPTGRADAARVVRSPWRSDSGALPGGSAWGRSDQKWLDEGIVVSVRPFGRLANGRVDLDVAARARWVSDAGRRETETPLGKLPSFDPKTTSWWGDVSATLGRGDVLVLFGAPSPFAAGGGEQIVVTLRLAE